MYFGHSHASFYSLSRTIKPEDILYVSHTLSVLFEQYSITYSCGFYMLYPVPTLMWVFVYCSVVMPTSSECWTNIYHLNSLWVWESIKCLFVFHMNFKFSILWEIYPLWSREERVCIQGGWINIDPMQKG